jgi:hypothetical protein
MVSHSGRKEGEAVPFQPPDNLTVFANRSALVAKPLSRRGALALAPKSSSAVQ